MNALSLILCIFVVKDVIVVRSGHEIRRRLLISPDGLSSCLTLVPSTYTMYPVIATRFDESLAAASDAAAGAFLWRNAGIQVTSSVPRWGPTSIWTSTGASGKSIARNLTIKTSYLEQVVNCSRTLFYFGQTIMWNDIGNRDGKLTDSQEIQLYRLSRKWKQFYPKSYNHYDNFSPNLMSLPKESDKIIKTVCTQVAQLLTFKSSLLKTRNQKKWKTILLNKQTIEEKKVWRNK